MHVRVFDLVDGDLAGECKMGRSSVAGIHFLVDRAVDDGKGEIEHCDDRGDQRSLRFVVHREAILRVEPSGEATDDAAEDSRDERSETVGHGSSGVAGTRAKGLIALDASESGRLL